ncbi:MAG: hypothetical protein Q9194_004027 [Teloschistes cf. exilis]
MTSRGGGNTRPGRGGSLFDRTTGGPPRGQASGTSSSGHAPAQLYRPPIIPPPPDSPIRNNLRRSVFLGSSSGLSRRDQLIEAARQQRLRASLGPQHAPLLSGQDDHTPRPSQVAEAGEQQMESAIPPQDTPSERLIDDRAESCAGEGGDMVPYQMETGKRVPVEGENGVIEYVQGPLMPSAHGRVGVIKDVEAGDIGMDIEDLLQEYRPEEQDWRGKSAATPEYRAEVEAKPETLLDRPELVPPAIRRFQRPRPSSSSASPSSPLAQAPPPSFNPSYSHSQQSKLDYWHGQRQHQPNFQQATPTGPRTGQGDAPAGQATAGQPSEVSIRGTASRGRGGMGGTAKEDEEEGGELMDVDEQRSSGALCEDFFGTFFPINLSYDFRLYLSLIIMLAFIFILISLQLYSEFATAHNPPPPPPKTLNLTAIATKNNVSVLECWQLANPLVASSTPGVTGAEVLQLGQGGNVSLTVIPPRFDGGLHNAPVVQYVYFTSGLAVVSIPNSTASVRIKGGRDGLIIAADTVGEGHVTKYPSNEETVALLVPTLGGSVPKHSESNRDVEHALYLRNPTVIWNLLQHIPQELNFDLRDLRPHSPRELNASKPTMSTVPAADTPKVPMPDMLGDVTAIKHMPNFRTLTNLRSKIGRLSYRRTRDKPWTDVKESYSALDGGGIEEPGNVQHVVFSGNGIQLSQFSTRHYSLPGSAVKCSFSEWQIKFNGMPDYIISEYKKKVILPSGKKPHNEFERFVSIRFQCQEAPTFSSRTEYFPGDEPSATQLEDPANPPPPAPETFPLAQLVNEETNAFSGCEIRLGFRRFNWHAKFIPYTWQWPAVVDFLGGALHYRWYPEGNEMYNADLADWANLKWKKHYMSAATIHRADDKDEHGNDQWRVIRRSRESGVPSSIQEVQPAKELAIRGRATGDQHSKRAHGEQEDASDKRSRTAIGDTPEQSRAKIRTYLDSIGIEDKREKALLDKSKALEDKLEALENELVIVRRNREDLLSLMQDAKHNIQSARELQRRIVHW